MKNTYQEPQIELISLFSEDILTSSDGFEGEKHRLFRN